MKFNVKGMALSTAFICMAPGIGWAGGVATIISEGRQTFMEYDDSGLMRMNVAGEEGYMLLRDGNLYSVISEGGDSMVFDVGQSMATMGELMEGAMEQAFFDEDFQEILSFDDTGHSETVAGIRGSVYEMRAIDEHGQEITETLVLSTDSNVHEISQAMLAMVDVVVRAVGEETASYTFMQQEVLDKGLGILRQGNGFSISSIDSTTPSSSRFELPAEPMEIPAMGGLFGDGMPDMSAFFDEESNYDDDPENYEDPDDAGMELPGVVGDQVERQQRRVESRTEREIDNAADSAVDRTVDRVFNRIFGN